MPASDAIKAPETLWLKAQYGGTIFLSAFLLFQVQPVMGKMILPWYGVRHRSGRPVCCSFSRCCYWATSIPISLCADFHPGRRLFAHCSARACRGDASDLTKSDLEAPGKLQPEPSSAWGSCLERGTALFRSIHHGSAGPSLVFTRTAGYLALSALCTFQCWLDDWFVELPLRHRARFEYFRAVVRMVIWFHFFRFVVRIARLAWVEARFSGVERGPTSAPIRSAESDDPANLGIPGGVSVLASGVLDESSNS